MAVPTDTAGAAGLVDAAGDSVAVRVAEALARIAAALKSRAWQEGEGLGLTPTQAEILALLARPGQGGLGLTAVADRLQVSRPTASDAVAALVRKGLLAKAPAATDRRAVVLRPTPAGAEAAAAIQGWSGFLARAVASQPRACQDALLAGLIGTLRALQDAGDIPVQRLCVTCRHFRPNVREGDRPHHCALADAPLADRDLRVDCPEQEPAPVPQS